MEGVMERERGWGLELEPLGSKQESELVQRLERGSELSRRNETGLEQE